MSKYSLIFIATSVLLVLAVLFVLFALTPPGWPTGGEVDVTVTPEVLIAGQPPRFKLEFNTHSVELDFDIEKITRLSDDRRKDYGQSTWEGSPPGGHHREGTLTFPELLGDVKSATLIISAVSGIAERKFTWQL